MMIDKYGMKPWYWVVSYFKITDDIKILQSKHGLVYAYNIDEAHKILFKRLSVDETIIDCNIKQIEINDGYVVIGSINTGSSKPVDDNMMPSLNIHYTQKSAAWKIWEGWKGNHDQRIEDASCTECGYRHPTVKGSLRELGMVCPACQSQMLEVEYDNQRREIINR